MSKHILPFHDHPLSCDVPNYLFCFLCYRGIHGRGISYHCTECDFSVHKECIERFLSKPFHCSHFLKIFMPTSSDANHSCHYCQMTVEYLFANCTICNISMDLGCMKNPPPLIIIQPRHHKHSLILLLRVVIFTCNACGTEGDRNPYVCLECKLMVHKDCIGLPRVININRHHHRISHTFHLGQGDWECQVCRKTIDWVYGAFTCSRCPSYAVHSKCATRYQVWDRIELEDVPEVEEKIADPFEVRNERDIIHFSHEKHILRLDENCVTDMRCGGCVLPINGDPCYKCVECDFCLHKACANHPRKKRQLLHNHNLILHVDADESFPFQCTACGKFSNGFRYECEDACGARLKSNFHVKYDVRCSSVAEPFNHDLHQHPLYWTLEGSKRCHACNKEIENPLRCTKCEYALCIGCATLPKKVKHSCDDHFLSLCQGAGNSSGDLWCDICETKTDPRVRYYGCEECGLSLHIDCVLGDLYHVKVGTIDPVDYLALELFPNNGATRPLCSRCEVRCKFPFFMRETLEESISYFCSMKCGRPY